MAIRSEFDETSRGPVAMLVAFSAAAIALGVWKLSRPLAPDFEEVPQLSSASAAIDPVAPPSARCEEISASPYLVGEAPPVKADPQRGDLADGAIDPTQPADDAIDDPTAPFAVEIGRGAAFEGGFAAGVRRDGEGGAVAMVATVAADGSHGNLVRLARSRGDFDAPVVAGAGASVLAVVIEPNASGRALKIAKITGSEVAWGPELEEGRDDSLAVGVAASGSQAVVVWDDLTGVGEAARSHVMLSSFDVATMRAVTPPRAVSSKEADASGPHLVSRPGGYWLAYVARGEEDAKKRKRHKGKDDEEPDDQGEAITTSWVEAVPLDESGNVAGAARGVTPKSGHVLSFDLALADNGSALIAWRDDDTPTGAAGGQVSSAVVRLGGGGDTHVLAERAGGAGNPDLLPGWVSIASVNGPTRIAAISPSGELLDELAPEPALGTGEPIAARGDAILWARPAGKAMRLSIVRCRRREVADAGR